MIRNSFRTGILLSVILLSCVVAATVHAETTVPRTLAYNGHLLGSDGTPVTTEHSIRFSLWTSADFIDGDTGSGGAINTDAATYAGWEEAFTVMPDAQGYFSVELGSTVSLPDFGSFSAAQLMSLHLQVEVKQSVSPAIAYELLDADAASDVVDRSPLRSVPFSLNADMLDRHDVGTGSGSIPVLGSGGLLDYSTIPGGTNLDTFILDANANAEGDISLQFGRDLGKTLTYDVDNARFLFNDDVRIEGDLTVTGLVNGLDLSTLQSSGGASAELLVSTGAGLDVNVAEGSYRLGGAVTDFAGQGNVSLADDATNYVFFGSGGLTISTTGFPTDRMNIRLAAITTSGGTVTSLTDKRVYFSDDTEQETVRTFQPSYEGALYEGDESDNVGQLTAGLDTLGQRNAYQWVSTRPTLQDYDILLRVTLPEGFVRWSEHPMSVSYRTETSNAEENTLDVSLQDTGGNPVVFSGSSLGLVNANWSSSVFEYQATPLWTPGGEVLLRLHLSAKDGGGTFVGTVTLRYVERKMNP